jgi:uncharacterized protein
MRNPPRPGSDAAAEPIGDQNRAMPRLAIVGASARAAAFSALRAGLEPVCLDQFADLDLQAFATAEVVHDYPQGVVEQLQAYEGLPVIYTGAMENYPEVLEQIAAQQSLLGNDQSTLEAVRDPFRVRKEIRAAHIPALEIRRSDDQPPRDGQWLIKPLRGGGGRGVAVWDDAAGCSSTLQEPHYFQQRATGETISAVFVASQDPVQLRYVGLTRQLIGLEELNAPPFHWCGSIGPVALQTRGEILTRRTGTVLAHRFGLRGLFGCDFVVSRDGEPLLTEVNPRYTGSVEVLELLCGATLLEDHCRATGWDLPTDLDARPSVVPTGAVVGKAIYFADRDLVAPDTSAWPHVTPWEPLPGFADLPQPQATIRQGSPVCTIFAATMSFEECQQQLLGSAASIRAALSACDPAGDA